MTTDPSAFLHRLFHATNIKEFVPLVKEAQEKYPDPHQFLDEVANYLPLRLYESYYDDSVPGSFFGLISASKTGDLFSENQRWWPFIQQSWFVTKERKREAWELGTIEAQSEGTPEGRWHRFREAAKSSDFAEAFRWAKGFLGSREDRNFFRHRSLRFAMDDTAHGGYKFLYLLQAWQLGELLHWKHLDKILFPPLHFIVLGPKDQRLSQMVKDNWRRNPLPSFLENEGAVSDSLFEEVEQALLFGTGAGEALEALGILAQAGASLRSAQDVLLLAAAQAVSNAKSGHWIWPLRAFHLGCLSTYWTDWVPPHHKTYSLIMTSVLLNWASTRSRETENNRCLDELAQQLCPTEPFSVLRSVISHSDPYASATAVYAILGMNEGKKEELFHTLGRLTVKNDGNVCCGNDLLFVSEAVDCYRRSCLKQKDKYLLSAAFFLGRIPKEYILFGEYGFSSS